MISISFAAWIGKPALLDAGLLDGLLGCLQRRLQQPLQHGIASDADDVSHVVPVAPIQHPVTTEAGVAAEDDADRGPALTHGLDQQRQDGPGMLGSIDLARAQVTDQQLLSAKDIQRQETIVVVIAVEKATFLLAMNGIIGCIKIQDQAFGWATKRGDELIDQDLVETPSRRAIRAILPTA